MTETVYVLASRWDRLKGSLIDTAVMIVILIPVMALGGIFSAIRDSGGISLVQAVLLLLLSLAIFLALNGYLLASCGQTIGKRLVGTRIVSVHDGRILPFGRLFCMRYLIASVIGQIPFAGNVFSLLNILFIFRPDRRCIHDHIAGTCVVNA